MQPPDFSYQKIKVRMGLLSGAVGAVGSIAGGLLGGMGANKAAKKAANIAQSQQYTDMLLNERAYEDTQPYRDIGSASANRLALLLGLGPLPAVQRRYVPMNFNDPFFNQTAAPYLGFGTGNPLQQGRGSTSSGQFPIGDVSMAGNPAYSSVSGGGGTGAGGEMSPEDIQAWQQAALNLFQTDPGYQFRQEEGQKAIERGAAARGGLYSGAAMKALDRYGEGLAAQEYDNYIKRLMATAGFGQPATDASIKAGLGFGALGQEAGLAAGNARGSGYANQASAMNSGITGLVGSLGRVNWSDIFGGGGGGLAGAGTGFGADFIGGW